MFKKIYELFNTGMTEMNKNRTDYKFTLQLRQDSKYFDIYLMLRNPLNSQKEGYIGELNKLWNSSNASDSMTGKVMSDRCKNILQDFVADLMQAVIYELSALVGPESLPVVNSMKSYTNVGIRSLNDLRENNPSTKINDDKMTAPELERIEFQGDIIEKYL